MAQRGPGWRAGAGALALAALVVVALLPPAPIALEPVTDQPRLWQGAYHVHGTRSDGSGTAEQIAAAARAAGLQFVILTDHGDATRPPQPPRYVHDVLLIDAVEISTDDGHYVAIGLPASPYPLAGEGRAVADDVRRLGGIGVLAHPDSPRQALAWHDWSVDADGFEWVNADTAWRTASPAHLLQRLIAYPVRPSAALSALVHYPAGSFARLDTPDRRAQLALAAVDAHARIGWRRDADPAEGGRTVARVPSYEASFGTFGLMVPWYDKPPTGDAGRDAAAVLDAIRSHVAYSAIFSMAGPTWLALDMVEPLDAALPGPDAQGAATLTVRTNGPAGATVRVLRNGQPWTTLTLQDPSVRLEATAAPAVYRAELWLPHRRGWPALPVAISPSRRHNVMSSRADALPAPSGPPLARAWHVEHDPASTGTVRVEEQGLAVHATLGLAPGSRRSQFTAVVADVTPPPTDTVALALTMAADAPVRVSIQLREPRTGEGLRWRHSAYLDATPRQIHLPIAAFRAIAPATGSAPLGRVHAVLFVLDTVNARPGDVRRLVIREPRWTAGR